MDIVEVENVVIGAGVIGLSIAAEISRSGREVIVLEQENNIGAGISSRNSEVIHSGIYYPKDSLRAKFCNEGRKYLYDRCLRFSIPHKKCGKLIVASTADEIETLDKIHKTGIDNGLENIKILDKSQTKSISPGINAISSLLVPDTGIIDSYAYMLSLRHQIESGDSYVLLNHKLISADMLMNKFKLLIHHGLQKFYVNTTNLILACGLYTHQVSSRLQGYTNFHIPQLTLAKGNYFSYAGPEKFNQLIYPIPVKGGLGTHLTFDLCGNVRFGPDVEWLESKDPDTIDYSVNIERVTSFYESIRKYWPSLKDGTLYPSYSGIRPKLSTKQSPAADFIIDMEQSHGIKGLYLLFGIESPGLTSSLAIAKFIVNDLFS